jgi:hypothetical protein
MLKRLCLRISRRLSARVHLLYPLLLLHPMTAIKKKVSICLTPLELLQTLSLARNCLRDSWARSNLFLTLLLTTAFYL